MLPLYDASLEEMETLLARSWEQLREARLMIEDGKVTSRPLRLMRDPEQQNP